MNRFVFALVYFASLLFAHSAHAVMYAGESGPGPVWNLYKVDPATAVTTVVGPIGYGVTGIAFHPVTGVLYGITTPTDPTCDECLITIDTATGAGTQVALGIGGFIVGDLAFRADGVLYSWIIFGGFPSTIDLVTGLATILPDTGLAGDPGVGVEFNALGDLLFTGEGDAGNLRSLNTTVNPVPVAAQPLTGAGNSIRDLAFHGSTLYGVRAGATTQLITIDPSTGSVSTVGILPINVDALAARPPQDAFKCYKSKASKSNVIKMEGEASLDDAFETKNTDIAGPTSVCEPVSIDGSEVQRPNAQMVCYKIKDSTNPSQAKFAGATITTAAYDFFDIFIDLAVDVQKSSEICVPSPMTP